eukprot:106263_1
MRPYHAKKSEPTHSKDAVSHSHHQEEDYMSMDFIATAQSFDDNRNNQINKRRKQSNKRKLFTGKNQPKFEPKRKKLKVRMEEQRNKGLAKPISKHNIGYKLLSKMGYKSNDANARKQPIEIKVRDKNSGIGIHEMKQRKINALNTFIETQKKQRHHLFNESIRQKTKRKQFIKEIKQSMIICENLDTLHNVNLHNPIWYKTNEETQDLSEDNDIDELDTYSLTECEHKLQNIVQYLRDQHLYCFWCGVQYADKNKMDASCPGNDKQLHDSLDDF